MYSLRRYGEIGNPGKWRGFNAKALKEIWHVRAFDIDKNAFAGIRYISLKTEGSGEVVDIGSKADALDNALDYDLSPFSH